MSEPDSRLGPIAGIVGAVLLFVGTYLHPMSADPNVPLAAFTEYAADHNWVASHLMQLFGFLLMGSALVLQCRRIANGRAAEWAILGIILAVTSMAAAAALQAVDGVALKATVNNWASIQGAGKDAIFQAAFAVRQIEVGLASVTALLFGLTASAVGVALLMDGRFPKWLGAIPIAGGVPTAIAGVVMAYTGFSDLAMEIDMPSTSLLLVWMIVLGIFSLRRTPPIG